MTDHRERVATRPASISRNVVESLTKQLHAKVVATAKRDRASRIPGVDCGARLFNAHPCRTPSACRSTRPVYRGRPMKISFAEPDLPRSGAVVVGVWEGKVLTPAARRLDEATAGAITRALAARVALQRQEERAAADYRPAQSFGEPDRPCRSRQARIVRCPLLQELGGNLVAHLNGAGEKRGDVDASTSARARRSVSRGSRRAGLRRAAQILSLRQIQDQAKARAETLPVAPDGRDRGVQARRNAPISRSTRRPRRSFSPATWFPSRRT